MPEPRPSAWADPGAPFGRALTRTKAGTRGRTWHLGRYRIRGTCGSSAEEVPSAFPENHVRTRSGSGSLRLGPEQMNSGTCAPRARRRVAAYSWPLPFLPERGMHPMQFSLNIPKSGPFVKRLERLPPGPWPNVAQCVLLPRFLLYSNCA